VAGIRRGRLASPVTVHALGGELVVRWAGDGQMAYLSGPAVTVFEGEIEV
jgi:diaminopimelate epimerase